MKKGTGKYSFIVLGLLVVSVSFYALANSKTMFFSKVVLDELHKKYGKYALNRGVALNKLIVELQKQPDKKKIIEVNRFFNNIKYGTDKKVWGKSDYWASPLEFLGRNKGDCEDFVIAKYFALRKLGIADEKLFLTYVKATKQNLAHMVLSYFEKPKRPPLILDNYNKKILIATKRRDLKPVYSFNAGSLFLTNSSAGLGKSLPTSKLKNDKWQKLLAEIDN